MCNVKSTQEEMKYSSWHILCITEWWLAKLGQTARGQRGESAPRWIRTRHHPSEAQGLKVQPTRRCPTQGRENVL